MHGWTLLALDVEADAPAAICDEAVADLLSWLSARLGFADARCRIYHAFSPQGLSDVCWSERGRIAIHTWPEWRRATIDVWAPSADLARWLEEVEPVLAGRYGLRVVARSRVEPPPHARGQGRA
jgi:hypothetical protein